MNINRQFLLVLGLTCNFLVSPVSKSESFNHFDSQSTGHSWNNAYLLGYVSYYAYRSKLKDLEGEDYWEKADAAFNPFGLEVMQLYSKQSDTADTQALILRDSNVLILAFSGSEAESSAVVLKDWILTDARITMMAIEDVKVHSGFFDALAIVYEDVKAGIEEFADERDVWITGHSLGAALAVMAAVKLDLDGIPVRGVYTYAGPRVGDQSLVDRMEKQMGKRFQRWIAERDPVPRVPPNLDKYPYVPGGVTNIIFGDGNFELDAGEEPGGVPNPGSHSMGAYVNYLYRGLPDDVRTNMPIPPSLCKVGYKNVGTHPQDGRPYCKRAGSRKISESKCAEDGGSVLDSWCLFNIEEKFRYVVREIKN